MRTNIIPAVALAMAGLLAGLAIGCDKESANADAPEAAAVVATASVPPPPDPPKAPDIVIDSSNVAVNKDRVGTGEAGLSDKVAGLLAGRPMIEGTTVTVVSMRNAKSSSVLAVLAALRKAKAVAAAVRTDARDGPTQTLPVAFSTSAVDCAAVAWINKDSTIAVWPAGGGATKRVAKGLAGPDVTLGGEAIRSLQSNCTAPSTFVGADEAVTWGMLFDLATNAVTNSGARGTSAVLLTEASPGRKLVLQ